MSEVRLCYWMKLFLNIRLSFPYFKPEHRILLIPQRMIGVPYVVIKIKIHVLSFGMKVIFKKTSAEGTNKRSIKADNFRVCVSYSLVNTADKRTSCYIRTVYPSSHFMNLPLFIKASKFHKECIGLAVCLLSYKSKLNLVIFKNPIDCGKSLISRNILVKAE